MVDSSGPVAVRVSHFWPLVLLKLMLSGCGFGLFIPNDPMSEALVAFQPGIHARADVIEVLGEPLVSLPDRGVDLFERQGELTDVLLPGIPYTTERTYYTLISYDQRGTLTGIDSGGYVYRSTLRAARFRYHMGYPGTLLEQEEAPAYAARTKACVIVLLLAGNRWSNKLYYQDPIRLNDLVLQGPPDYRSYYYLVMEPGEQRIQVTWSTRNGPSTEERSFECAGGDILYLILNSSGRNSTIDIRVDVPSELSHRALILFPPLLDAPLVKTSDSLRDGSGCYCFREIVALPLGRHGLCAGCGGQGAQGISPGAVRFGRAPY